MFPVFLEIKNYSGEFFKSPIKKTGSDIIPEPVFASFLSSS
jgi:hypothetical protein